MRARTRGHLLAILAVFWSAGLLYAKTQQTFVVRYKNGDHTVPVTVVLDYKKQTEYVINMSPRAATKTVTLYDFKQKTIAYKDLTNRECFLGRLTHETMSEETDALTKIHSPVESQPKVLSLDPHRTSLTPTEIRNMAGQRTAVFCGKMNTWLVLPKEGHAIQKREVEEVDERTFHRHGYHTVRYSHFGRETRRRYRNPASRRTSHKGTDTTNTPNSKAGNSETASENSAKPFDYPSIQQQFTNPSQLDTHFHGNNFHHSEPPGIDGKGDIHLTPTFYPGPNAENWHPGNIAAQPNGLNNGYETQFPFYPAVIETPNFQGETGTTNDRTDNREQHLKNFKDAEVMNGSFGDKKEHHASHSKPDSEVGENRHYSNQQNIQNQTHSLNGNYRQSGIEDDSIPLGFDYKANQKKLHPKIPEEHNLFEDPDVSSNVLEIPKLTKKFENIGNSLQPPQIPQTNEDVHDVFEGFFNLRKSDPPSDQLLYNSYFIPSEQVGGRERSHPDESLINSYPSVSHTRSINDTDKNKQWGENKPNISKLPAVIASTSHPSLTTNAYSNYNRATISPNYWEDFSDSRALNSRSDNGNNLGFSPQKVAHRSRSQTIESLQPISTKDGSFFDKAVHEYFTTGNPLYTSTDKIFHNQRSDVTVESKLDEITETFTPRNLGHNLQETNERQILFNSSIPESISSQQIRFQNVLRNYKPDEIVIDVEKIPTQRPPESTLGFQGHVYSTNRNVSPNVSRNANGPKSGQSSGDIWRGKPNRKPNFPVRKHHNLQPGSASFVSRIPPHPRRNESNLFQHRMHDNNIRQLIYPTPQTLPHTIYNTQRSYKLENLPPGVSIHPRHPKAPYADVVRPKILPPVAQGRTPKLHRQRHHKKKDRLLTSCCRTRGKTKGCCGSCCRSKSSHARPSCCSSTKSLQNELRPKQVLAAGVPVPQQVRQQVLAASVPVPQQVRQQVLAASVPVPQQVRQQADDPRNRCQKEKLCRTLYESTQQVMVCRHAKIEGC